MEGTQTMEESKTSRIQKVNNALGIVMVEGMKPSAKAMELSASYINGKITAKQLSAQYLKSIKESI